jgi:hypothetical protein
MTVIKIINDYDNCVSRSVNEEIWERSCYLLSNGIHSLTELKKIT